jgi:RND family efflux transporter MFP subunit
MSTRITKIVLPIVVLSMAIGCVAFLMANKIEPDRLDAVERSVPVEIAEIAHTTEQIVVEAQGTVMAAQQVQLRPEVAGRIVELSESLVPGGRFLAGQTVASIDERDYRVQLFAQQEAVARAKLALRQEQARQSVAEQEWELLEDTTPAHESNRDLALRIPQIEQAEAAITAAEGALSKAELDLERCTITAPFNAVVLREQVDQGQLVNPQTEVATLIGTDVFWVQVSLPIEHLEWIEIPGSDVRHGSEVTVVHSAGSVEILRTGRVERLLGDVDPAGRMARLLISVDDPLNLKGGHGTSDLPLLLGSYVTVHIRGRSISDAIAIPRRALREVYVDGANGARQGLWIMNGDDRLVTREAQVIWRTEKSVIVSNGFADGERLITSTISTPIEGMKLVIASGGGPDAS